MQLVVVDALSALVVVLVYLVLALLVTGLVIGVPAALGKVIYDRARDEDLANPAALGFTIAFFALLVGVFILAIGVVYVG